MAMESIKTREIRIHVKFNKMRVRYVYTVDGGENPGWHQPKTLEITKDFDTGEIIYDAPGGGHCADLLTAENRLYKDYDYVELRFIQSIGTTKMDYVLKNEPLHPRIVIDFNGNVTRYEVSQKRRK